MEIEGSLDLSDSFHLLLFLRNHNTRSISEGNLASIPGHTNPWFLERWLSLSKSLIGWERVLPSSEKKNQT